MNTKIFSNTAVLAKKSVLHIPKGLNKRGERVQSTPTLFDRPESGKIWRQWADRNMPTDVYKEFGLLQAPGAEMWQNVIEHNVFVAATALTIANMIQRSGMRVKTERVVRAAMVHDVTKRRDVESYKKRESEADSHELATILGRYGYSPEDIAVAVNTGRSQDLYITDVTERNLAIEEHSLEANIVGYADARTHESHVYNLKEAQRRNLHNKLRAVDAVFFHKYWLPYYKSVENYLVGKSAERYLMGIAPTFDPNALTDQAIYQTVLKITKDYHRQ